MLECKNIVYGPAWLPFSRGNFLSLYSTSCRGNYLLFSFFFSDLISYALSLQHIKTQQAIRH